MKSETAYEFVSTYPELIWNIHVVLDIPEKFVEKLHEKLFLLQDQQKKEKYKKYWVKSISPKTCELEVGFYLIELNHNNDDENDSSLNLEEVNEIKIDFSKFSNRTQNCFKTASIFSIFDLIKKSESDLLSIKSFGQKCLTEVKEKLETFNLKLKKDEE